MSIKRDLLFAYPDTLVSIRILSSAFASSSSSCYSRESTNALLLTTGLRGLTPMDVFAPELLIDICAILLTNSLGLARFKRILLNFSLFITC